MNGSIIKEFLVGLGFSVDENSMAKFSDGIKKASIAVTTFAGVLTGALAGVTSFVAATADKFDAIGDLGDRVNTTAEEILRLGYVATLTGSDFNAATSSLESFSRTAGEAALGIGRGQMIFKELGISAKDGNGQLKDTSVLLGEVGRKIQNLGRGEQLAVLTKLGIDPTLIQALTTDVTGLVEEFDKLYKTAGIDANKAAEEAGEFNDSLDRLKMTFDGIKNAVALRFLGSVKRGIDTLRKFLIENMPKIINAVSPIIDMVLRIAEAFITIAGRIGQAIGLIIEFISNVVTATDGWAKYIGVVVGAWLALNSAFLKSPIGIILSLGAALTLLIDDFITWKEGGESFIDWSKWKPQIDLAIKFVNILRQAFEGVLYAMSRVGSGMKKTFEVIFPILSKVVDGVKQLFNLFSNSGALSKKLFNFVASDIQSRTAAVLSPSPSTSSTLTSGSQSINQNTNIVVQASANPDSTARAIAGQQNRVNADMARNMRSQIR